MRALFERSTSHCLESAYKII